MFVCWSPSSQNHNHSVVEYPSAKRSKPDYKICGQCHKELNLKIYKEHKRLYYDAVNKSWVEDDAQGDDQSSSDLSSIDDIDLLINCSSENATQGENQHSDNSDFLWEEPLSTPEDTDEGTCKYSLFHLQVSHV